MLKQVVLLCGQYAEVCLTTWTFTLSEYAGGRKSVLDVTQPVCCTARVLFDVCGGVCCLMYAEVSVVCCTARVLFDVTQTDA